MNKKIAGVTGGLVVLAGIVGYGVYRTTPVTAPSNIVVSTAPSTVTEDVTTSEPSKNQKDDAVTAPPVEGMENWKTFESFELSFNYPDELGLTYIHPTAWPPVVEQSPDPYTCTVGGSEESTNGKVEKITVYNQEFCKTVVTEAAAGSVYKEYTYETKQDGRVVSLDFTLQEPQCGNYNDTERSDCEAEHTYFDVDTVAAQILSTLVFQ